MATELKYVAQQAMDNFYQSYVEDTNFFTIDDFISYTGNTVSAFYTQMWKDKYAELRQEKKDEMVTFDTAILGQQIIKVPKESLFKRSFKVKLDEKIMSFPYDQNNCGFQAVFYKKKDDCEDFENRAVRTTVLQKNSVSKTPICDRVFFYYDGTELGIINRRMLPVGEILCYYVPAVSREMLVPEGIIQQVISATVMMIKESAKGVIIQRELGNNPNRVLEGELDKSQLKR